MSGGFFDLSSPSFKPTIRLISSIGKGATTLITTEIAHDYLTGMTVKIIVPDTINTGTPATGLCGMTQINKQVGKITVTGLTTFTMDIDSSNFDDFAIPGTWDPSIGVYPQVVPVSEENEMTTAAVKNVLT